MTPPLLRLQRAAGNRAVGMLLRRVTGDVTRSSIGDFFAEQLTPDELRQQVALVVDALDSDKLDTTEREVLYGNLEVLQENASTRGFGLPAATGYHMRQAIKALGTDLRALAAAAKGLVPSNSFGAARGELQWSVEQLEWVTDTVADAAGKVAVAQAGGPRSAEQFREAGRLITAAIPVSKAIAAHMAYLQVATKVEEHYPHSWSSMMNAKLAAVRESFNPLVMAIRTLEPSRFDKAVADLLKEVPSWSFDFSQFVDDLQEKMQKRERFLQWVGIIQLALLAFDIWMLPVAGRPGSPRSGGGPNITGSSGGAATAGVLASAPSLEALRELIRLGILTNPGLVKIVGGGAGPLAPPKPMHTDPKPGKPAGGSGGKDPAPRADKPTPAKHTAARPGKPAPAPDPNARPAAGLPSLAEDALVQEYTRGLAKLREKREILERLETQNAAADKVQRAKNALAGAQRELAAIEERALQQGGEALEHLNPLTAERTILGKGTAGSLTGKKIECEAVARAPKNLRYKDFAEIEAAMGRKPDGVIGADKAAGAGLPSGHQRLWWKFKDGSRLVVDLPRALGNRARSADMPHAELHGPKGERLDPQGITVPEQSIAAHLTITDRAGKLAEHFARARGAP